MWNINDMHSSELEKEVTFLPVELTLPSSEEIMTVCCGASFTIGITHTLQNERSSSKQEKEDNEGDEMSGNKIYTWKDGQENKGNLVLHNNPTTTTTTTTTTPESTRHPLHVFTFNTGSIELNT